MSKFCHFPLLRRRRQHPCLLCCELARLWHRTGSNVIASCSSHFASVANWSGSMFPELLKGNVEPIRTERRNSGTVGAVLQRELMGSRLALRQMCDCKTPKVFLLIFSSLSTASLIEEDCINCCATPPMPPFSVGRTRRPSFLYRQYPARAQKQALR
jgi:hypothetical protein